MTDAEWVKAHRANALFDARHDDPGFGSWFLVEEARDAGQLMAERTAWRICRTDRATPSSRPTTAAADDDRNNSDS